MADWRGAVVVRGERLAYERTRFDVNVFLSSRKTFNNSSKIVCVLKRATTVYERETCIICGLSLVVGSRPCSERFSPGYSGDFGFSLSSKTN